MTGKYKYPYVPQEYYPAVMFAIKMFNQGQTLWIACYRSAKYYKVDTDELRKHVKKRLSNKHKYYTVFQVVECDDRSFRSVRFGEVVKALDRKNATEHGRFYSKRTYERFFTRETFPIVKGEYATKKEAEQNFESDWNKTEH